jgi:hypothetical protein
MAIQKTILPSLLSTELSSSLAFFPPPLLLLPLATLPPKPDVDPLLSVELVESGKVHLIF